MIAVLILFGATDVIYKPARVSNLFFTNTPGFSMRINEFRGEGGSRLMYNKLLVGTREFVYSYSKYFSPQFLIIGGDENPRFGNDNLAPITAMEYLFLFIGAILEGLNTLVIGGFLASVNKLNVWGTFLLLLLGHSSFLTR